MGHRYWWQHKDPISYEWGIWPEAQQYTSAVPRRLRVDRRPGARTLRRRADDTEHGVPSRSHQGSDRRKSLGPGPQMLPSSLAICSLSRCAIQAVGDRSYARRWCSKVPSTHFASIGPSSQQVGKGRT